MTINSLLSELNESQFIAATMNRLHALVLAGAGCGKTKTIIARAAFLISEGTPSHRIQILTFTRRAASEIVERVRMHLGDTAKGLKASTFHTWCISLIRKAPLAFGCKGYSVIDRDDQLQLFKVLRGRKSASRLPTAAHLCDLYSFARNTGESLNKTLMKKSPEFSNQINKIAEVMLGYESKKKERRYLDYDDILDVVAQRISTSPDTCAWLSSQYDHILIDEMQDTNPLQWKLVAPLINHVTLFCVGDDAQSIYGFRGADFRNVHSFQERVEGSTTVKLERNYRSTQEILTASNWLLAESPLDYGKELVAARGIGKKPQLHTFANEWEEGRWVADDLLKRKGTGAHWREHMILVRSGYAARVIEVALLSKDIPYRFIGGAKLLESAHVRDVLSTLRLVANHKDEIAWMRFLTLWNGVGEITANRVIEDLLSKQTLDECIEIMNDEQKIPSAAIAVIRIVREFQNEVAKAVVHAVASLEDILSNKYRNQEWDKRKRDFRLVEKIALKHTSILSFIEEYLLDPVHVTQIEQLENNDIVTIITIHSAKGTESEVCYVVNVSPGAYPSQYAYGDNDAIEEERRVLYVALTRAKYDLIVTRQGYSLWATTNKTPIEQQEELGASYFFNDLPEGIFEEHVHRQESWASSSITQQISQPVHVGIIIENKSLGSPTTINPFPLQGTSIKIETLSDSASFGSLEAAKYFLENGADPNTPKASRRNDRWAPLHYAAWNDKFSIAELLIKHGANVNQKNSQGQTPLMWAAKRGAPQLVKLLIGSGADVFVTDFSGNNALDYARHATQYTEQVEITVNIIKNAMETRDNNRIKANTGKLGV